MQNSEGHSDRSSKNELLLTEAYNPEAYNSVAKLGFFSEPIKIYFLIWNYWEWNEISEIVARNLYRDVNDAVQKAFTVLVRGNILRKTEYSINPQTTSNDQDWVSSS